MAITKLTSDTIKFSESGYYKKAERVFDALCALSSDIEVIEKTSDESTGFRGYFRLSWAPEYAFLIYNNEDVSGASYKSQLQVST